MSGYALVLRGVCVARLRALECRRLAVQSAGLAPPERAVNVEVLEVDVPLHLESGGSNATRKDEKSAPHANTRA